MKKPLYHTMVISDLTAEVLRLDRETAHQWLLDFVADLNQNEPRKCKTSYAKNLMSATKKRRGKSSESGKKGVANRWPKKEPKNNDLNTPPVDDLDTSSKGKGKTPKPLNPKSAKKFTDEDMKLALWIFDLIAVLDPSRKKPNFDSWANTVRLMREIDKLTHREIAEVFKWANSDPFWNSNILSPSKLREKFSDLRIKKKSWTPKEKQLTKSQQLDKVLGDDNGMDQRNNEGESKIIDITPVGFLAQS